MGFSHPLIDPRQCNKLQAKTYYHPMVQVNKFRGLDNEDPKSHLATFFEPCDTFKMNGVSKDMIHLSLFLFSLKDKA